MYSAVCRRKKCDSLYKFVQKARLQIGTSWQPSDSWSSCSQLWKEYANPTLHNHSPWGVEHFYTEIQLISSPHATHFDTLDGKGRYDGVEVGRRGKWECLRKEVEGWSRRLGNLRIFFVSSTRLSAQGEENAITRALSAFSGECGV